VIKRTLEISREPAHLAVRHEQLLLQRNGQTVAQVPCEDLGVVLVDHPQVTYTHAALVKLAESAAVLVVCGRDHLPAALLLPLGDHSQVVWRLHDQLALSKPLAKQLWKQLVQAKIRHQAGVLPPGPARNKLLALARGVRSGDPNNREALAARIYWQHWLGETAFRRDADAAGLNSLLNYGYAVVRAAVARAIVAAGLLPAIGLKHCHRANSFCLADDLIEPLRPLVDDRVRDLYERGYVELTQEAKAELLKLLAEDVRFAGETGPLMVTLHRFTAAFVRCLTGETAILEIPQPCNSAGIGVCGS